MMNEKRVAYNHSRIIMRVKKSLDKEEDRVPCKHQEAPVFDVKSVCAEGSDL